MDCQSKMSRRSFLKKGMAALAVIATAPLFGWRTLGAFGKKTGLSGREAKYYRRGDHLAG